MDPHWSVFIIKSLLKVFKQSAQSLPFLAKLHAAWSYITWNMGRHAVLHINISWSTDRKVTATCSITSPSNAPVLYCPSYSSPFASSSELVQPDPFCPNIVWFLSRNCVVVSSHVLSLFGERLPTSLWAGDTTFPMSPEKYFCAAWIWRFLSMEHRSTLMLEMLEEGLVCSQMTLKFFLLKIILESYLYLPRRITAASQGDREISKTGWCSHSLRWLSVLLPSLTFPLAACHV